MADLEVWKDYVTVINAARLNAMRDQITTNEGNISYHQTLINANTTDICNLSNIKLSRDGSQPMTGELKCNSGIKTDTINTMTEAILECQKPLQIDSRLYGNSSVGLWLYSDFDIYAPSIRLYSYNSSLHGKILIGTPGNDTPASTRIEIPGKADFVDIKIRESNILPYDDNYQDLGNSSYRWKKIYASQITTGELICNDKIKTNSLTSAYGTTIHCDKILEAWSGITGNGTGAFGIYGNFGTDSPYIELYPFGSSEKGKIVIGTPNEDGTVIYRMTIPGGEDFIDIDIREANILPYSDNYQNLGGLSKRWKKIYGVEGDFSGTKIPDDVISNASNIANLSANIYNVSQTYFRRDGTFPMTGNILLGLGKALILDDDSDTYLWGGYLDDNIQLWVGNSLVLSADSSKVTLAKTLDLSNCRIQNLSTPSSPKDAANKQYVDDQVVGTIQLMPIYFRNITNHEYLIGGGTGDTKFMWGASVTAVKYTITGNFTGPGRIDIGFYYGETADSGDDYSFTSGAAGGFKGVRSLNISLADIHGINVKVYNISNLNYATWTLKWHYN